MVKVLFQSINPQLFRAIGIGYLYEIAQKHEVVLLIEKIDPDTQRILHNTSLFPGLKEIIFFESPFQGDILRKNYRLAKTLKKTVQDYNPDIVITYTDMWPADMYMLRFAKKAGAITVAMQAGFKIAGERKLYAWSCLMNTQLKVPRFLPFPIRLLLVKAKKYIGHFFYYWILPLTVGEKPFWGKTSFVFWDEASGLRDADYSTVFSKRDHDLCRKDGVASEKIFVIGHPLEHAPTKRFFEETYFSQNKEKKNQKTLTIMWPPETIGFEDGNYSLISQEKMRERRGHIVKLIAEKLAEWHIFIKPHPSMKDVSVVQEFLKEVPNNVSIVEPSEPADKYIEMSSVIVGIPLPSTTLFTAQKQHPHKIILSLNINNEFLGDSYKDFNGIEYIDTEESLIRVLHSIRNNTYAYEKKGSTVSEFDFSDARQLIDHLFRKTKVWKHQAKKSQP